MFHRGITSLLSAGGENCWTIWYEVVLNILKAHTDGRAAWEGCPAIFLFVGEGGVTKNR